MLSGLNIHFDSLSVQHRHPIYSLQHHLFESLIDSQRKLLLLVEAYVCVCMCVFSMRIKCFHGVTMFLALSLMFKENGRFWISVASLILHSVGFITAIICAEYTPEEGSRETVKTYVEKTTQNMQSWSRKQYQHEYYRLWKPNRTHIYQLISLP